MEVVELGRQETWQEEVEVVAMLQSFRVIEASVFVFPKPEDAYFEILCLRCIKVLYVFVNAMPSAS